MSVDVSPDGEALVFDLLGDIYTLPLEGGDAVPLTAGAAWDQAPRFSPDGKYVYFVSDREGNKNLWRLQLADHSLQRITYLERDILGGPNWSPDGSRLLAGVAGADYQYSAEVILNSINPVTGAITPINAPSGPWMDFDELRPVRNRVDIYSGVESADGKVFFSERQYVNGYDRVVVRMYQLDLKTRERTAITSAGSTYSDFKPQLSPDGRFLTYYRQYNNRRTELRIVNRVTKEDIPLVVLTDADDAAYTHPDDSRPNYAFTPDNRFVVFWHRGKIHSVNVTSGSMQVVPFRVSVQREVVTRIQPTIQRINDIGEASTIRWPSFSRDGQTVAFSAVGYIWLMDVRTGDMRRLSDSNDFEYMPAISPDGKSVAYISFSRSGDQYSSGRLIIADSDGGKRREILGESDYTYLIPQWSRDGSKIAMIRRAIDENGVSLVFGWTLVGRGSFHEVASAPASSGTAGYHVYARYVGFNDLGEKLLFSYPQSSTKTVLASANLDGSIPQILAIAESDVGGITPAPDLKNLVLNRRDGSIWVVPFDIDKEPNVVSTRASNASRLGETGGFFANWTDLKEFTFSLGRNVHRYRLDDSELGSGVFQCLRVSVPIEKPKEARPIAFTGARVITMSDQVDTDGVIERGTIVVDGERIVAIGRTDATRIPSDALVFDAVGKTILPGFLDTHYHRIGGTSLGFALPNTRFSDESALSFGVTSAWEPGGAADDGVPALADLQVAGRIAGPRWSYAATGAVGRPNEFFTSYAVALDAVEQHRDLGVTTLKEYLAPTRQQRKWLSAAAYGTGLGIVSHLQSFDGTMTRIVDGYTGGDHPYLPVPYFKDVSEMLRQTGFIWTPNAVITSGTIGEWQDKSRFYCDAVLERRKQGGLSTVELGSICDSGDQNPTISYEAHRVSRVARQVAIAARNGTNIGVSAHNMPGSNLHQEMGFLWRGGMNVEDVLRATTMGNARKIGLQEEIGSLEIGKIADFLVLDENPLDDILNTLSLRYTVQSGVVYDSATANRVDSSATMEHEEVEALH